MGAFRLAGPDGLTVAVTSRRARGLLAYLALAPEQTATRERLCGLLWSDRGEAQARASLRQSLLELRGLIEAAGLDLIDAGRESVALRLDAVACDVTELEHALASLDAGALSVALAAVGIGRLLDDLEIGGLYRDWLDQTRARLDQSIGAGVIAHLERLEARRDWPKVRVIADAFLRRDPLDEAVVAAAIRADIALGATTAAHRRFQLLETALAKEFGVPPGPAVREALTSGVGHRVPDQAGPGDPTPPALPALPSIAVLPFRNLGGDPEREYFADAISEDVAAVLSRWRWFFVIARNSSFAYKGRDIDPARIGNELGVRYVLEGSVRTIENRVRVTAQLVDAADGAHIWADRFDRDLVDILALHDEISERVAAAIEPAMLHREGARIVRKRPADFSALDCYYRGMWHLNRVSNDGYGEALTLFREAIERDGLLSLGHIGLARILFGGAVFGWSSQPMDDLKEARAAARTAIGLDNRDACAYFASAGTSLYLGDHGAALDEAKSAVSLNANFAPGQVRLGQVLIFSGRPAEAIAPIERCLRLSPYDPQQGVMLESLALAHYHIGKYDQAVIHARAAMHHNHARASVVLAAALAQLGRDEEAAKSLPREGRGAASPQSPMAAPYADPAQLEHLRQGVRLARMGGRT